MAKGKQGVWGEFAATHYSLYLSDGDGNPKEIYRAGNSRRESQGYVPADEGVGIEQMARWCEQEARSVAKARRIEYFGIQEGEDEDDLGPWDGEDEGE